MRTFLPVFAILMLASCDGSDSGGEQASGGAGGTSSGGSAGLSAGGTGGSAGSGTDAGDEGGGAVGNGGTTGDSGSGCGGADFASCEVPIQDGYGACWEASGFPDAVQKGVFDLGCSEAGGTLSTTPCSHAYPNVGGCSMPSNFCWVIWNLTEDDSSTPENEHEAAKQERGPACEQQGGTYYAP